jgi:hypothetical protein
LGTDLTGTPKKDTSGQLSPFFASMVQQLDYYLGQVFDYLDETEDPRWPATCLAERIQSSEPLPRHNRTSLLAWTKKETGKLAKKST